MKKLNTTYLSVKSKDSFVINFFVIVFLSTQIYMFNPKSYFIYFLILILNVFVLFLLKNYFTNKFLNLFTLTIFIQGWSILSTNLLYEPFHHDYSIFAVPIYQLLNPELFLNDIQSNTIYPHVPVYFIFSKIINFSYFNFLFFLLTVLQSNLFANIFYKIKIYLDKLKNSSIKGFYLIPFLAQPLSAGMYTFLPYFLPSIFVFGLSTLILIKFYLAKENVPFLWYLFLIFIHPFWGLVTHLIIFCINIIQKKLSKELSINLILLIGIHYFIYSSTSLSSFEVFELAKSGFFDLPTTGKNHYYWFYAGNSIIGPLNGFIQIIPLIIAVYTFELNSKISIFDINFSKFVRICSLLLLILNFFPYSFFHNLMISTNFMRLGSYSWVLIGVFIAKNKDSYVRFNSLCALFFSSYIFTKYFYESYLVEIIFCLAILSIIIFFKINRLKLDQIASIGVLLVADYFIIPRTFLTEFVLLFFVAFLSSFFVINWLKINTNSHYLFYFIFITTIFFPGIQKIDYEFSFSINRYLDTNIIETIQENSKIDSLFLIDPNDKYFRRDVVRSTLFTFNNTPYDQVSAKRYIELYEKFINFENFSFEDFNNIIETYNISHIFIENNHKANESLKNFYVSYKEIGNYLLIIINN